MSPNELKFWQGCRASLRFFTTNALGLKWPSHYSEWEHQIGTAKRGLFEAPRASWKTYFFSLAYPLWRILRGKTEVLLTSDSEGQAMKNLRTIRQFIENKDELAPMRPSTKELWGTDQISFPNGSLVTIMGFGTSKRGTHPDIIINDDIEGENNRMSREDKDRMYFGVIAGMCLPSTEMYTVGTPMEFGDILEQLSKNEAYAKWRRPSEQDGKNLYPDIWTDSWLEFRRKEMGSLNYAREMLLDRIDPATQPFKREYTTLTDDLPDRGRYMLVNTVCDPAYTEGDGDYTAIVTVGITHGNHGYILRRDRLQRDQPGEVVGKLFEHIQAFDSDNVGIKRRKGDAISFSFEEHRTRENLWDFNYVQLRDTKSKTDKSRIGGLVPRWEARTIHIPKGMDDLLKEFYEFRLNDSHKHDDMLDAIADCFSPDMARPNAGKQHKQLPESRREAKTFLTLGASSATPTRSLRPGSFLGQKLDRRIYDAA